MQTVQFDPNTGRKLNPGESVTYQGKTYTQGSSNISGTPVSSTPTSQPPVQNSTVSNTSVNNPTVNNPPISSQAQPTSTGSFSLSGGNLAIGSSGQNVSQLQQALNAQGANLVVDGKFGPLTQQAVQTYQQNNGLKVDGIVGPLTTAKLSAPNGSGNQQTNQISQITPNAQIGLLGAIADVATNTYSTKNSGLTLDEALNAAKNDPNIVARYSDMLKLDTQGFTQAIDQLRQSTQTQEQQQQTQFENDRKALAEHSASAGQAYSGFRGEAQKQLGESQSGIVSSSRSAIQKSLNDMTSAFEGKYGSGSASPYTASFKDPFASSGVSLSGLKTNPTGGTSTLAGQLAGGITGTNPLQQKQDVLNKGASLYQVGQLPQM